MPDVTDTAVEPADAPQRGVEGDRAEWMDHTAMRLVDAILAGRVDLLEAFLDDASRRRRELEDRREQQAVFNAVADWGATRLAPRLAVQRLVRGSAEQRVVAYVADHPDCTNSELAEDLSLTPETISRAGRALEDDGLVTRVRSGKWKRWQLSPAGRSALSALGVAHEQADGRPARPAAHDSLEADRAVPSEAEVDLMYAFEARQRDGARAARTGAAPSGAARDAVLGHGAPAAGQARGGAS